MHIVLAVMALSVWIVLANNDFFGQVSFEDQLLLIALLPGAFLLGMSLIKD